MVSSSTDQQLVLFDCDDGRLSIFKNHAQYLSRIPSNCECYVFWNDLKFPVYRKLRCILQKYSHIHLCPSYDEQRNTSCSSNLLFYLQVLICKFSFVLLVHDTNHGYRQVFQRITKQYGIEKMGFESINKPFSQHLPNIIKRLEKKNHEYRYHKYLRNLLSKEQLKYPRRSLSSNSIWNYDNNLFPYDFEEKINFKRIIKRKQKALKIDLYNNRLDGTPRQLSAELDDNDYIFIIDEETQNFKSETDFQKTIHLLLKYRKLRLTLTFVSTRYFDGNYAECMPSNIAQPLNHFKYQKSMLKEKGRKTMKPSIDTKRSNVHKSRERANRNNLINKSISCPQCIKKFRVAADLEKHFCARHAQPMFISTTNQAKSTIGQTVFTQAKKNTEEDPTYLLHNFVSSSNPTENFGSTISRNIYSNANHAKSTISETTTSSQSGLNCKMTAPFNQTKITESRTHTVPIHDIHLNTKHVESNLYNNTDRLNIIDSRPMMTKDHVKKFCCWKCTRNFKTTSDRLKHFIHKHATSFRSKIIELSTPDPSRVEVVHNVLSMSATTAINTEKRSFICWQCTKKILSDENLIGHFVEKHADFILSTDTDPSSILQDQIVMAEERSTIGQKMTIPTTVLYNCSQCSKKFTSSDALANHFEAKHTVSTVPLLLNHFNNHSIWIQKSKKATKRTVNTIIPMSHHSQCLEIFENRANHDSPSNVRHAHDQPMIKNDSVKTFSCWICSKKSKSRYSRLDHFIKSHSASFLPTINMSSTHPYNQTTRIEEQTNSSNTSSNPLYKSNNCWECGKKFKSYNSHISHFMGQHIKQFLFTDIDPSNRLKNQITKAQEKMKAPKNMLTLTKIFYNCFQCGKEFKSDNARTQHFKDKHAISTFTPTNPIDSQTTTTRKLVNIMKDTIPATHASFNSSEYSQKFIRTVDCLESSTLKHIECTATTNMISSSKVDNHTELLQQHIESTKPEVKFIQIPYYSKRCKKDFLCTTEYLEHSKREHSEVNYSISTTQDGFTGHGIIKCPRAKYPTLVYMLFGTYRKQICIKFGKTNRCPHDACRSKTINYEFDELQSHITKEHHDVQLKLECCNPMVTYTLEEYKNHLVHCDEKQEILWYSTQHRNK